MALDKLTCTEAVERVTEYLEGALTPSRRAQFDQHLSACPGCQTYLEQMRTTTRALAGLREEQVLAEHRRQLMETFRRLQRERKKPAEKNVPLGIHAAYVQPGEHLAYFWESEEEFEQAVGFLEMGLRGGDFCVAFGHDEANQKILASLRRRGLAVEELLQKERMCVLGGNASGDAMLAYIGSTFQRALAAGASLIRLLGNLGWGRKNWPSDDGILEFEAKVTQAAQQFPCVVVCMYDVRSLAGRILLKGGFETHPCVVHQTVVRENPHYVPTDEFLAQLKQGARRARIQ